MVWVNAEIVAGGAIHFLPLQFCRLVEQGVDDRGIEK